MIKAWVDMWKRPFDYSGVVTRKAYWLALLANVIFMYLGIIPCVLVVKVVGQIAPVVITYIALVHVPVLALYFRRANDARWKKSTTFYLAFTIPVLSGLLVGAINRCNPLEKSRSVSLKLLALSFALFFYAGMLGIALHGDPAAYAAVSIVGLLLGSGVLIVYGIIHKIGVFAAIRGR